MSSEHSLLSDLGYVQISQFEFLVFSEEQISAFDISMNNFVGVQGVKSFQNLGKEQPTFSLRYELTPLFRLCNLRKEVSAIRILKHDVECHIFNKGFLVGDDVVATKETLASKVITGLKQECGLHLEPEPSPSHSNCPCEPTQPREGEFAHK